MTVMMIVNNSTAGEVKELIQESQKVGSWRGGTRVNLKHMGKFMLAA